MIDAHAFSRFMKCVSELYGKHPGSDIYVIGTGASLRVFPLSFFEDKITIGLNMAWKVLPVRYGITIHPDLNIPEFMPGETPHPDIVWITKQSKCQGVLEQPHLLHAEKEFYSFETPRDEPVSPREAGEVVEWLRHPTPGRLYVRATISSTAVNLAANMGARNVILVGCDNCALANNHHAHEQHTRWLGASPAVRYNEYYEAAAEVRSVMRERGVSVVSLTPFMGLTDPRADFKRLCQELSRPYFVDGKDISPKAIDSYLAKSKATSKRILQIILGERVIRFLKQHLPSPKATR